MESRRNPSEPPVSSLDRALQLLDIVAQAGPEGLSLHEIREKAGLNKGTAHRLLSGLVYRNYVSRDHEEKNYVLGDAPRLLVQNYSEGNHLPALFRPLLMEVSQQTEELVHLGAFDGRRVVYLDKLEPERSVRVWSRIGRRAHVATTALGRALTAANPADEFLMDSYILEADPEGEDPGLEGRFREAVASARKQGYSVENQENEIGIACVGVALLSQIYGDVAISVTAPADRMPVERLEEIGNLIRSISAMRAPSGFAVMPMRNA